MTEVSGGRQAKTFVIAEITRALGAASVALTRVKEMKNRECLEMAVK